MTSRGRLLAALVGAGAVGAAIVLAAAAGIGTLTGGAAEAMAEAAKHAADCPTKPIAFEGFPPLHYTVTRISDSKLVKGYLAAKVHRYGTYKGKKVDDTFFVVYQRVGDVISGVYSYAAAGVPAGAQQAFCLHAAEQSAKNLRGGSPGGISA